MSLSFSVVTPCLDQAAFLPGCIASVAEQTHPVSEHLVLDPGSTDGSRDIAEAAPSVRLVARPDQGQADAVSHGFELATGDVLAWLNADDRYTGATVFARVAERFAQPDRPDVVYGRGRYEHPNGESLGEAFVFDTPSELPTRLKTAVGLLQPAVFVRRSVLDRVEGPRSSLRFAMDYDFWIRLASAGATFAFVDDPLAVALVHEQAKTQAMRGESLDEAIAVAREHFGFVAWTWAQRKADWELNQAAGLVDEARSVEQSRAIDRRAQQLFDGYNRNLASIARLVRPPWDRAQRSTLGHLIKRVR